MQHAASIPSSGVLGAPNGTRHDPLARSSGPCQRQQQGIRDFAYQLIRCWIVQGSTDLSLAAMLAPAIEPQAPAGAYPCYPWYHFQGIPLDRTEQSVCQGPV